MLLPPSPSPWPMSSSMAGVELDESWIRSVNEFLRLNIMMSTVICLVFCTKVRAFFFYGISYRISNEGEELLLLTKGELCCPNCSQGKGRGVSALVSHPD